MTLSTLYTRLRASLGFNGFKDGGTVHNDQAHSFRFLKGEVTWNQIMGRAARERRDDVRALKAQIAHMSSTLPPKKLRTAEAMARLDLDKARRAIRTWELANQVKIAKAENDIAAMSKPRPVRGWS